MKESETSGQWAEFMKAYPKQLARCKDLEERLGYGFKQKSLLFEAVTHRSSVSESNVRRTSSGNRPFRGIRGNERIEFLGDSILGLVVSTRLYENKIASDEGKLSKIRAGLVSEGTLAEIAVSLGLPDCLVLGKGEEKSGGRRRESLLADALEAVFGALYLDGGTEKASLVIEKVYKPYFDKGLETYLLSDYKTRLQELTQEKFKLTPTYEVVGEDGPDHHKEFVVECRLGDKIIGIGKGHSKKKSSRVAAFNAFETFNEGSL
jgi:ribonuclease-3